VENKEALAEGALESYLDIISGPIGQASFYQHQVAHYDSRHTEEVAGRLHELESLPVRLIWGKCDAWQPVKWARQLHASIPGSDLHIIPNAGHFVMEDDADAVSALLTDFLGSV